jgi:hypothetical protein
MTASGDVMTQSLRRVTRRQDRVNLILALLVAAEVLLMGVWGLAARSRATSQRGVTVSSAMKRRVAAGKAAAGLARVAPTGGELPAREERASDGAVEGKEGTESVSGGAEVVSGRAAIVSGGADAVSDEVAMPEAAIYHNRQSRLTPERVDLLVDGYTIPADEAFNEAPRKRRGWGRGWM